MVTVRIQYSLFLVSSWECLEIGLSLSIGRITFRLDALVCVFHSISLACFLPRAFVIFSWLGTPLHFVVTHLMLRGYVHWSSFHTVHVSRAQYLIFCWILDSIFDSTLIFSLQKSERHIFIFTYFLRDSPWSPYHFFLMELELEVESRIFWSRFGYRSRVSAVLHTPFIFFTHRSFFGSSIEIL